VTKAEILAKIRVWDNIPEGSTPITEDTRIPLQDKARVVSMPKTSSIHSATSTGYRLVTDRQTDTGPYHAPC